VLSNLLLQFLLFLLLVFFKLGLDVFGLNDRRLIM
jgi:hypothetical protein